MVSVNAVNVNQPNFRGGEGLGPEDAVKLVRVLGALNFEGENGMFADEVVLNSAGSTCNELSQKTNSKALKTVLGFVGALSTIGVGVFAYKKGLGFLADVGGSIKDRITKKPFDLEKSKEALTALIEKTFKKDTTKEFVGGLLNRFGISSTRDLAVTGLAVPAAVITRSSLFGNKKEKDKEQDNEIANLQKAVDATINELAKIEPEKAQEITETISKGDANQILKLTADTLEEYTGEAA